MKLCPATPVIGRRCQLFLEEHLRSSMQGAAIWIMDRGIPTKKDLEAMRQSDPPVQYLVGTPKGSLKKLEKKLLELPWQAVPREWRLSC